MASCHNRPNRQNVIRYENYFTLGGGAPCFLYVIKVCTYSPPNDKPYKFINSVSVCMTIIIISSLQMGFSSDGVHRFNKRQWMKIITILKSLGRRAFIQKFHTCKWHRCLHTIVNRSATDKASQLHLYFHAIKRRNIWILTHLQRLTSWNAVNWNWIFRRKWNYIFWPLTSRK